MQALVELANFRNQPMRVFRTPLYWLDSVWVYIIFNVANRRDPCARSNFFRVKWTFSIDDVIVGKSDRMNLCCVNRAGTSRKSVRISEATAPGTATVIEALDIKARLLELNTNYSFLKLPWNTLTLETRASKFPVSSWAA